ncbi:hypothetical protein Scep_019993 [Stephania cephalantha]|uniref:Uncharacterized protein n=1 Tax=Stephania cephalantha TaxID=152367 RepID=A0AAP0IBS1_9MAGN
MRYSQKKEKNNTTLNAQTRFRTLSTSQRKTYKEENTTPPVAAACSRRRVGQHGETPARMTRQGNMTISTPEHRGESVDRRSGAASGRTDNSSGYGEAHDNGTTTRDDGEQRRHNFVMFAHEEEGIEKRNRGRRRSCPC